MALLKRIGKIIQANINQLRLGESDPEQTLAEVIASMEQQVSQVRQGLAAAIASHMRLERQSLQAQQLADRCYQKAQQAWRQGNTEGAKAKLQERLGHLQVVEQTNQTLAQGQAIAQQLKQDLRTLEQQCSQAKAQQHLYVARARMADTTHQMQILTNDCLGDHSSAFEQMEQRVHELEALAELGTALTSDDLQRQFSALESQAQLEADFAQLQAQS